MRSKKFFKLVATIFAVIITAGAAGISRPGTVFAEGEGGMEYNTSIPAAIYDFKYEEFSSVSNLVFLEAYSTDEGVVFEAQDNDPSCQLYTPAGSLSEMDTLLIKYRTSFKYPKRCAEIYFSTESIELSEIGKQSWTWKQSEDGWAEQTVVLNGWQNVREELLTLRFDPLASGAYQAVEHGEAVVIEYMAFFPDKKAAAAFNIDEYRRYEADKKGPGGGAAVDWEAPAFREMKAIAADNAKGTISFTDAGNGQYTMSYEYEGRRVSFTLPDTANFRNGPLAGTDDLGRKVVNQFSTVDPDYTSLEDGKLKTVDEKPRTVGVYGENGEHFVGIFYFLWLESNRFGKVKNISAIMEEYGEKAKDMPELWGKVHDVFFFAEPLYGYYSSGDPWIIRKHMELLSNAGVDFLYFDTTNNYAYTDVVQSIVKVCHKMNEEGFRAPKIVFYTNYEPEKRVKTVYDAIYKDRLYSDTWLYVDGKPLIIAPESANIDGFFTTRNPQWPNEARVPDSWPWIDWKWPQEVYGTAADPNEAISVSVAQHSGNGEFSTSGLYGYTGNRGRSFDGTRDRLTKDSYKLGLNLRNEFNYAYVKGSKYILVTGWNEWIVGRQESTAEERPLRFIDSFDYEYSRDIEMTRGGYFDNYYMQLASNAAVLKGAVPSVIRDDRHQINVTGSFDQWDGVEHSYRDPSCDNADRNYFGSCAGTVYEDSSGLNDIVAVKVTNDATYLHFMVECAGNIQRPVSAESTWMQIFLNVGGEASGWYGYDYVVNYSPRNDFTTGIARYSGSDREFAWTEVGEVTYRAEGRRFMISVPMEMLGIEYIDKVCIEFKVADSRTAVRTMEQFYTDGDAAPLGRLNYVYQTYIPEEGKASAIKVVKLSERPAMEENDSSLTPVDTGTGKKGCGGTVLAGGARGTTEAGAEGGSGGATGAGCAAGLILAGACGTAALMHTGQAKRSKRSKSSEEF